MLNVKFDNVRSWEDLGFSLDSYSIGEAQPKLILINVPYSSVVLDLTESLGAVGYGERECEFSFTILDNGSASNTQRYNDFVNSFHGKRVEVIDRKSVV